MTKKMYFIFSQLREEKGRNILIMIEFMIAIVALHIVIYEFKDFYDRSQVYESLNLENMVCFMADETVDISELAEKNQMSWCSENKVPFMAKNKDGEWIFSVTPYTKVQAQGMKYPVIGNWFDISKDNTQAVISPELATEMDIGKTYTVYEEETEQKITFEVVGILKKDKIFYMPNDSYSSTISQGMDREVFLYSQNKFPNYTIEGENVYLAKYPTKSSLEKSIPNLQKNTHVDSIKLVSEAWEEDMKFSLSQMTVPSLIATIIVFLLIINIISNNLLSIQAKERSFGILFLNGATQKQCFYMEIVTDMIPVIGSILMTEIVLFSMRLRGLGQYISIEGFVCSMAVCFIVLIGSVYVNMKILYKKEVLEMIEGR